MPVQKIVIDPRTKTTPIDATRVQLDLVAFPMNEHNQREPGAEIRLYANDVIVKTFISDASGVIQDSVIVQYIGGQLTLKLKDITSNVEGNVADTLKNGLDVKMKERVIAELKIDPNYMRNLEAYIRNDAEIVKYALEQNGLLLQYAGEDVRNDKVSVLLACNKNQEAFQYASVVLKTDEEFVIECIKKWGKIIITFLSPYVKNLPGVNAEIAVIDQKQNDIQLKQNDIQLKQQYQKDLDDLEYSIRDMDDRRIPAGSDTVQRDRQKKDLYIQLLDNMRQCSELTSRKLDKLGIPDQVTSLRKQLLALGVCNVSDMGDKELEVTIANTIKCIENGENFLENLKIEREQLLEKRNGLKLKLGVEVN